MKPDLCQDELQELEAIASTHPPDHPVRVNILLKPVVAQVENPWSASGLPGIASGFADLDAATQGFQRSDLIVVASRPSIGKTAFCLNIAHHVAKAHGLPVCIFSLEMSNEQVIHRLLAAAAQVEIGQLRSGQISVSEWERLNDAHQELSQQPIYISDRPTLSVSDVQTQINQIMAQHEEHLGLIVIDPIQFLEGEMGGDRNIHATPKPANLIHALKKLAKTLNVPVLVSSQLTQTVESRPNRRPTPLDLGEFEPLNQAADMVMMLYRDEHYNPNTPDQGIAELLVTKHRNGPTGTLKLRFDAPHTRFYNLT